MEYDNLLLGILFTAIFIGFALWHIRENTKLEHQLSSKTDGDTSKWIIRFAWSRTLQMLGALACIIVLIIGYDRQLSSTQQALSTLSIAIKQRERVEQKQAMESKAMAAIQQPPAQVSPTPSQNPIPAATVQPLATVGTPAPAPQPVAQATPVDQANNALNSQAQPTTPLIIENTSLSPGGKPLASKAGASSAIEALYNPERNADDQQSSMDDIKKRYEDIFVIHMFLKRCGKVQPQDHAIISNALSQEITAVKAPDHLRNDILTSAQGSYNEIYSKSPCDGEGAADLNTQYIDYIKILATNFPSPT